MNHWESHLRYYDLFQMSYSKYLAMLEFHRKSLKRLPFLLDSGAGTGNLTLKLLEDGHQVVALDNNDFALKILSEKCKDYHQLLKVTKHDVTTRLPFPDNYFDGIASSLVIPFVENIDYYLSEIHRVLKIGERLSLSLGLPKKGVMKYIMNSCEKEAKITGLLPRFQTEWIEIWKTSKINELVIMEKNITKSKIATALKEQGFTCLKYPIEDPYEGRVLLLSCQK